MNMYGCLTPWFCKAHNIDKNEPLKIEYVDARDLLVPERLDLIIKYKYVEAYEKHLDMQNIKKIYKAHIEAFSNGTYTEPGQEKRKKTIEDYYREFNKLIESIKRNGFDERRSVVPVNEKGIICNGSHRVAIAMFFGIKVPCVHVNGVNNTADYTFFKERLLSKNCLDYMAVHYCKQKKNVYAACIWPAGYHLINKNHLKGKMLTKLRNVKIIYEREFSFNYRNFDKFIKMVYYPAEWLGSAEQGFPGSQGKSKPCYSREGRMLLILFVADNMGQVMKVKESVRKLIGIENHSIHITDNYRETVYIIKTLFYGNTLCRQWCLVQEINNGMRRISRRFRVLAGNKFD